MKLNAYAIFDTASGTFMRPFFCQADAQAVREFGNLAIAADHPIGQHPEDYSVARLGTWDDNTGKFYPESIEYLVTGLEMVHRSRNVNRDQLELITKEETQCNQ